MLRLLSTHWKPCSSVTFINNSLYLTASMPVMRIEAVLFGGHV